MFNLSERKGDVTVQIAPLVVYRGHFDIKTMEQTLKLHTIPNQKK